MFYKTRALIINSMDYLENDKILTVFTEDKGKIKAIAKGVKKPKSSLRACVQPICFSDLHIRSGKSLEQITQGRVLEFYGDIREDINCLLNTLYIFEILDKTLHEKAPLPELFASTLEFLNSLAEKGFNPLYIRYFELNLLIELGYRPLWNQCCCCGRITSPMLYFCLDRCATICDDCKRESQRNISIMGETAGILNLLSTSKINIVPRLHVSPQALKQIEMILEKYMEYHFEKRFSMKATLSKFRPSPN